MACSDCKVCTLISNECLWKYTPLKGFEVQSLSDVIDHTNFEFKAKTGLCDLCEGVGTESYQYTDLIATEVFKRAYCHLIYYNWMVFYGSGHASQEGMIAKQQDDIDNGFKVLSSKEVDNKINRQKNISDQYMKAFEAYIKENYKNCFTELEETTKNKCCTKKDDDRFALSDLDSF